MTNSRRIPESKRGIFLAKELAEKSRQRSKSALQASKNEAFLMKARDWCRAVPNHLARSSLFVPVRSAKPVIHNEIKLVSRKDAVITYTGEQLNETQADVVFQLLHLAVGTPLGNPVSFVASKFLRQLGRSASGQNYDWLRKTMKALAKATLIIEAKSKDGSRKYIIGDLEAFHIVQRFWYQEEEKRYSYILDPRWVQLFSNNEYALVDWEKRLKIRRNQDMAKSLQQLVATNNAAIQRYDLSELKKKMCYTGRCRDFENAIERAVAELKRVEIAADGRVQTNREGRQMLVLWLLPKGS